MHRAAPSASLPRGDEVQKSINPTFTVVVYQPSSPAGRQLLYVIPAAGITYYEVFVLDSVRPWAPRKGLML